MSELPTKTSPNYEEVMAAMEDLKTATAAHQQLCVDETAILAQGSRIEDLANTFSQNN